MRLRIGYGVALVPLIAIGLSSCDDSVTPPAAGAVEGVVADVDGNVLQGIGVILVDPVNVATVSPLTRTDTTGRYHIGNVAPGDYAIFLYDAGRYGSFARTTGLAHVVAGSTTFQHRTLVDSGLWHGGPLYISGTVKDATTGRPLAGAYVSNVYSHGFEHAPFEGITFPEWGVTDEAGRFTISSTDLIGATPPISVTKAGYEPVTLVGRGEDTGFGPALPSPTPPDTVLNVGVQMYRLDPMAATGALAGRVVRARAPVAGVLVMLSLTTVADPDTFPPVRKARGASAAIEALVPGKTAVTDADGRFSIAGLHPGQYAVYAAARPDDGFASGVRDRAIVSAAHTEDVGDVVVFAAMTPLAPSRDSNPPANQPIELQWTPPALPAGVHVVEYRLQYGTGYVLYSDATATQPSLTLGALPPHTPVRWYVEAIGVIEATSDTIQVGAFEETASFVVAGVPR